MWSGCLRCGLRLDRLWVLVPLVGWVQVGSGVVCFEVFGSNPTLSKSSHRWEAVGVFLLNYGVSGLVLFGQDMIP